MGSRVCHEFPTLQLIQNKLLPCFLSTSSCLRYPLIFFFVLLLFSVGRSFRWALALFVTENFVACAICAVDGFIFVQFRYVYLQGIISCVQWHTTNKKWQHNNLSPDMSAVCTCGCNQNTADQRSPNGCIARKFFLLVQIM